jgi:protoporphyrinogen oxidase
VHKGPDHRRIRSTDPPSHGDEGHVTTSPEPRRRFVIAGGGPAGLTAALELLEHGLAPAVFEKDATVGGISRTENHAGFRFDMGGHRFFTKVDEVQRLWERLLGDDLLERPRLSRIYYRQKFFTYPLAPVNALCGLGLVESARIIASYAKWRLRPHRREETFEQWVVNRFGKRLFETFFKTYTEKVWGISCSELSADWAAQRIQNLSLRSAILNMFRRSGSIRSLIEQFHYPRLGPGMMWEAARARIEAQGGQVATGAEVVEIRRDGPRIDSIVVSVDGERRIVPGTDFISSMPITELVRRMRPAAPREVLEAAARLRYRAFLTVGLIIDRAELFPDNWIYVHDPSVHVGRIQNFKNWSPCMVPDASKTALGLEYFCAEGDELWTMSDRDLIELARAELEAIGLADARDVVDGCVFRVRHAYPMYDAGYAGHLATIRAFVDSLDNLQTIGRNGLHRYNNQDHAMLTGLYAVRNAVAGARHDLWQVNADQEYHEVAGERQPGRNGRRAAVLTPARVRRADAATDAAPALPQTPDLQPGSAERAGAPR